MAGCYARSSSPRSCWRPHAVGHRHHRRPDAAYRSRKRPTRGAPFTCFPVLPTRPTRRIRRHRGHTGWARLRPGWSRRPSRDLGRSPCSNSAMSSSSTGTCRRHRLPPSVDWPVSWSRWPRRPDLSRVGWSQLRGRGSWCAAWWTPALFSPSSPPTAESGSRTDDSVRQPQPPLRRPSRSLPSWTARNDSWSTARSMARLTDLAPCPTLVSRRSSTGRRSGIEALAH